MKITRKKVFALGLFFLFIGSVLILSYNFPREETEKKTEQINQSVGYTISGFYEIGERLILGLPQSFKKRYILPSIFNVTVYCPSDNREVVFRVEFIGDVTAGIIMYNCTVLKNEGGLEAEEGVLRGSMQPLGVAMQTGNYTVQLGKEASNLYISIVLTLWKESEIKVFKYPYRNLLPFGVALICIGIIFSLLAFRTKSKVKIAETKYKYRKYTHRAYAKILVSFLLLTSLAQVVCSAEQVIVIFIFKDPSTIPHCQQCPSCCAELFDDFSTKNDTVNSIESSYANKVLVQRVEYDSELGRAYRNDYGVTQYNSLLLMNEKGNFTKIAGYFNETYIREVIDAYLSEMEKPQPPPQPPPLPMIAILITAFTFGFFETISPCLIALLSFVLSYTVSESTQFKGSFLKVMVFGIGFVLSSIFTLVGLSVGLITIASSFFYIYHILTIAICIFAIFFGANLLGIDISKYLKIKIETKPLIKRLAKKYASTHIKLLILGLTFYFLDPCLAPAFALIVSKLSLTLYTGFLPMIFLFFSLGTFIPFVSIGLLASSISTLVRGTYKRKTEIRALSGLILIAYAIYLLVSPLLPFSR